MEACAADSYMEASTAVSYMEASGGDMSANCRKEHEGLLGVATCQLTTASYLEINFS